MKSGSVHEGSKKCVVERDRLSELSDELLVDILSFLPTEDAIRTVLLRRFGNLWTVVPSLSFDNDEGDYYYRREKKTELFSCFSRFVYNVLVLHKRSTIDKFCLTMRNVNWSGTDKAAAKTAMEVWIRFALSREAKTLKFSCNRSAPAVPVSVFTSQSLVRLELHFGAIQIPCRAHMGSLRTLEFRCGVVEDGDFNEFVSGCPCLQEVLLIDVFDLRIFTFSAPSVEKLHLIEDMDENKLAPWTIDCPNLKILDLCLDVFSVNVINVPSARELTINSHYRYHDTNSNECAHQFKGFLEGFPNVEVVTLECGAVQQLTNCLMAKVGFPHIWWKRVVLKSPIKDPTIAGICSLVRHSPCLEELIIHAGPHTGNPLKEDIDVDSQEVSFPCVAPNLKVVSMHGYVNLYDCHQLQLVKYLLKSAPNLEELVVCPNWTWQITPEEELQFFKRLTKFSRASRKPRIVFGSDYDNILWVPLNIIKI